MKLIQVRKRKKENRAEQSGLNLMYKANLPVVVPPNPFQEPHKVTSQSCKIFPPSNGFFVLMTNPKGLDPGHL